MNRSPVMKATRLCWFVWCLLLPATDALAQNARVGNIPEIAYVYPAGGRRGTTFTVKIGGQRLSGTSAAFFSAAGVHAEVTGYYRFLTQKELTDVEEKIRILKEKRTAAKKQAPDWTEADETELAALQAKLEDRPNRQVPATLAETVTLEVTLPAETPPGTCEVRLKTPAGLSDPCAFQIGNLPEIAEPMAQRSRADIPATDTLTTIKVDLPALINGRIMPAEVDRFRFPARRGQRLVFAVSARALIPYLADAVPGWFQATLALYDAKGHELAYVDDFKFEPDPILSCEIPADGDYTIEIKDALHRGREDFVYRIIAGELPFVTGVFPLGGPKGVTTRVSLSGWNLPASKIELPRKNAAPTESSWAAMWGIDSSLATLPFAQSTGPEAKEEEPNDTTTDAQAVSLPVTVNGRIQTAGDRDIFCFKGRAGDQVVAEVLARRLHSPLDSVLLLANSAGQRIAFNDDHEDKGAGLITHQADSFIQATLPADGVYFLTVQDTEQRGGEAFAYRLRLGPPEPDFTVLLTPSTLNLRPGACLPVTAHIVRRDGFEGEINLALIQAPEGFTLSGARLPARQTRAVLTLNVPTGAKPGTTELTLQATAHSGLSELTHPVQPADERMQAFLPRHLVPAKALMADVSGNARWKTPPVILTDDPLKVPAGGTARFRVRMPNANEVATMRFELSDPPDGVTLSSEAKGAGEIELTVTCDAAKLKPGFQDNLLIRMASERAAGMEAGKPRAAARSALGNLPAVSFEVVKP